MQFINNTNRKMTAISGFRQNRNLPPEKWLLQYFRKSMLLSLSGLVIFLLAVSLSISAQSKLPEATNSAISSPNNPLSTFNKFAYGILKNTLLRSAEKMPEESYNFKPADTVRSYGQIIGHIADSQYTFCSTVLGEKNPALTLKIEKTKTSKADLIAALKDAFIYCDKAYDNMTDAAAVQMVKFSGFDMPKFMVLIANNQHSSLHYGNLVTYLRMKNIVPPTSEPGFLPQPNK